MQNPMLVDAEQRFICINTVYLIQIGTRKRWGEEKGIFRRYGNLCMWRESGS